MSSRAPRVDRPRSNREPAELRRKEGLLRAPHVLPLTEFVEDLRRARGGDETVPWFDPTEAGTGARILALLETPGRKSALRQEGGSQFVSADNDDPTAEHMWRELQAAEIDRGRDYAAWNVVPWYVARGTVTQREVDEARPALVRLFELMPDVRVVLLLGQTAQRAWAKAGIATNAVILKGPHPSPLSVRTSADRRQALSDILVRAKQLSTSEPPRPVVREREVRAYSRPEHITRETRVDPARLLEGHFAVPGDKSISHRALLIGAVCDGETRVRGFGRSGDTESTLGAVRALGAGVDDDGDELVVHGAGLRGLTSAELDCGNAGTLARLVTGLLAFQEGTFTLTGDESLSARPMERVAEPLRRMGAAIETTDGHLPLTVTGGALEPVDYQLPVASAQVKSAVLLAGLGAKGRTTVVEPEPTRDHTELMLQSAGAKVTIRPTSVSVDPATSLRLGIVEVPGDFSSAAPFIVAATLLPESRITIHDVSLNPRRTGLLDVLDRMGGRVGILARRRFGAEQAGDIEIRHAELTATTVNPGEVPLLVDELPLFGLLAACARGQSRVRGAAELRHKETDRIEAVVDALRALGVRARAYEDGFTVQGVPTRPRGGKIDARGDHRIAMLGAIAGVISRDGVRIQGADTVAISFPGFFDLLDTLSRR